MIDINNLTNALNSVKNSIQKITQDVKDLEKILVNSNFPIAVSILCYKDINRIEIYLTWDKDVTGKWRLLATKVWEDDTGINTALVPVDNLKVIPKSQVYPYLKKLVTAIEKEAVNLKLILSINENQNQIKE